eukprot:22758-Eustigmatos_ZCMA.PRE.1
MRSYQYLSSDVIRAPSGQMLRHVPITLDVKVQAGQPRELIKNNTQAMKGVSKRHTCTSEVRGRGSHSRWAGFGMSATSL